MAVESRVHIPGISRLRNWHDRKCVANPPKNVSGNTATGTESSDAVIKILARAGNGSCIAAPNLSNRERGKPSSKISQMRSLCSSAATMLSAPSSRSVSYQLACITRGSGGKTSNISFTRVLRVQQIRKSRRCGGPSTMFLHLWQTWTSVCHVSVGYSSTR